jgi:hypothetical protein
MRNDNSTLRRPSKELSCHSPAFRHLPNDVSVFQLDNPNSRAYITSYIKDFNASGNENTSLPLTTSDIEKGGLIYVHAVGRCLITGKIYTPSLIKRMFVGNHGPRYESFDDYSFIIDGQLYVEYDVWLNEVHRQVEPAVFMFEYYAPILLASRNSILSLLQQRGKCHILLFFHASYSLFTTIHR